jgi:hypothetical protein
MEDANTNSKTDAIKALLPRIPLSAYKTHIVGASIIKLWCLSHSHRIRSRKSFISEVWVQRADHQCRGYSEDT